MCVEWPEYSIGQIAGRPASQPNRPIALANSSFSLVSRVTHQQLATQVKLINFLPTQSVQWLELRPVAGANDGGRRGVATLDELNN